MRTLIVIFLLVPLHSAFGQTTLDVHVGSLNGIYTFPDLKDFANSYNTFYANDPDLIGPLKFKTLSTGYQVGVGFSYGRYLNAAVDVGSVTTGVSRAEWGANFNRGFQIKSFLFDMDAGIFVTPSDAPFRLSVGLGVSLQSTQIEAFLEYGKTRSYGSESSLNGVWSSWKGYTPLVVKGEFISPNQKWKFYSTFKLPIQKKKVNSVGYTYSADFTSAGAVFPLNFAGTWSFENRLSENFRFINLAIGVGYIISYTD
jgi:hypothetical protein